MKENVNKFLEEQVELNPSLHALLSALQQQQARWRLDMESNVQHWWKLLSLTDARFYPTEQTLKNFLAKAKNRFHFSNSDVESLTTSIRL